MNISNFYKNLIKRLDSGILITIAVFWLAVVFGNGIFSVLSWTALLLIVPILGLLRLIITIILMLIQRKLMKRFIISIAISILMIMPFSITLGLTSIVYPSGDLSMEALVIGTPFKEDVTVGWGGDLAKDNKPHVIWASERYAYDLVKTPYNTGAKDLKEYGIYGLECFSPISGTVVAVCDKEPDILPNTEEFTSLEGNYVYIRIESTGTYLLLNHFQKGTIAVTIGEDIQHGTYLGKMGNSGTTSEPHLHIHHQSQDPTKTLHPILAEGLPLLFSLTRDSNDINIGEVLVKGKMLPGNYNYMR